VLSTADFRTDKERKIYEIHLFVYNLFCATLLAIGMCFLDTAQHGPLIIQKFVQCIYCRVKTIMVDVYTTVPEGGG
jgi:hypothetical protein